MFSNILCAVDGSKHALKAAEAASELAAMLGAKLTLLTVTKDLKVTEEIKRYMEIENLTGSPQYVLDSMTEQVLQGCGFGRPPLSTIPAPRTGPGFRPGGDTGPRTPVGKCLRPAPARALPS